MYKKLIILASCSLLAACGAIGKMDHLGKPPSMTSADDITAPVYERALDQRGSASHQSARAETTSSNASLFRSGGAGLFSDQRARRLGDIVTVKIQISDRANIGNTTSRSRSSGDNVGVPALLGLETILPDAVNSERLVNARSSSNSSGNGQIQRSENIDMTVAAIVTQVLPNGNLIIQGKQEVRVNFELRDLVITGIVRPEDIARDNTVRHTQIAEARVSYGGRGHLTDVQQARYGQQIFDALFPY